MLIVAWVGLLREFFQKCSGIFPVIPTVIAPKISGNVRKRILPEISAWIRPRIRPAIPPEIPSAIFWSI